MARKSVVGRFSRSKHGYGFVRPLDARSTERDGDIRVPFVASADAANGDTVRVRITKESHVGRPGLSGEVVEVVERRTTRFVGVAFQSGWRALGAG
jgi:exoribonuclease R